MLAKVLNLLNLLVSIYAMSTLIWWHGFKYSPTHLHDHKLYLLAAFGFFGAQFVLRKRSGQSWREYLSKSKLETVLLALVTVTVSFEYLTDFSFSLWILDKINVENPEHLKLLLLHSCLLIVVGIELGKAVNRDTIWKLPLSVLMILSFLILIIIGSSVLMLPEMTNDHLGLPFVDAMFTSISANCVTGLTVVDTAQCFTLKGHVVLLVLIQLGGVNIIFFASMFILKFKNKFLKKREKKLVKQFLNYDSLNPLSAKSLFKKVFITTLVIELVGAALIYYEISNRSDLIRGNGLFESIFHSVSAFNNAGFSIFDNGFGNELIQENSYFQLVIMVMIIIGGLGFTTLWNMFDILKNPKRTRLNLNSKISIYSALTLIFVGTGAIFLSEQLSESPVSLGDAAFQSVSSRTAGFSTVNMSGLSVLTLTIIILLMFIGGASGSTAGGIKTSTAFVLLRNFISRLTGRRSQNIQLYSENILKKSVRIFVASLLLISVGTTALILVEPEISPVDLLFEEFSAFGTVGLSTGITPELSTTAKIIVQFTILIGRLGPLVIAYTLLANMDVIVEDQADIVVG